MSKFKEKLEAQKLRRDGCSIRYITDSLRVSKGSVSIWCRDIKLSDDQITNLELNQKQGNLKARMNAAESKRKKRLETIENLRLAGIKDIGNLTDKEFFTSGLGIYWGEGTKTEGLASISNSDPQVIIFMIKWFKKFAKISNIDFSCQLGINEIYSDQVKRIEKHWSNITGIPLTQFTKTSIKHVKNKKIYPDPNMYMGTIRLRIRRSTNLQRKIMGWIEGLNKAA